MIRAHVFAKTIVNKVLAETTANLYPMLSLAHLFHNFQQFYIVSLRPQ